MNKDYILNTSLTEKQIALFYLGQEGYLFKYKNTNILKCYIMFSCNLCHTNANRRNDWFGKLYQIQTQAGRRAYFPAG